MQTVTYGRQFFDNGYYTENEVIKKVSSGKAWSIAEYIKELNKNHDIVLIYYVDDDKIFNDLLSAIMEEEHWDFSLRSIIPTKNVGTSEVIELLEESIKKNNTSHIIKENKN